MSINPETDLDLEKLFLPAWAQGSPSINPYAKFTGEDRPERREDRRGPRPPRREGGGREPHRNRGEDRARGPRREGAPGQGKGRGPRREERRDVRERREPPPPLPEINVTLVPDEKGVDSLARQVKVTGRAYPLFDIAFLILQKPERYSVRFSVKKNSEGQPIQPLFLCALDETLWLSEDEAIAHVLQKHFATFYQAERTATEPPKGVYTFVAQCGISGTVLGPPNHHDYQNLLRKLHSERFSRMPFEVYKSRIRIVRDEAVVKQWIEDQSWKTEYICLNVPEPLKLQNRAEVENHFRKTHKESIIKPVESHVMSGIASRSLRGGLHRALSAVLAEQRRFPMQIATALSQAFAQHGLHFFKVNKTVTHVSVARPLYLDLETTPVSEGIKRIVEFINANPKCSRRKLMEALAPSPAPAPISITPADSAPTEGATTEAAAKTADAPDTQEPTPEQTALIADLHWLIHQGHVIEFANGVMETAKKPAPKPPKPAAPPAESASENAAAPAAADAEKSEAPVAATENSGATTSTETPSTSEPANESANAASAPTEETSVPSASADPEASVAEQSAEAPSTKDEQAPPTA